MFDFGDNGDVSVALDVDFNIEVWSSFGNQNEDELPEGFH